jgi:hypothetical protein
MVEMRQTCGSIFLKNSMHAVMSQQVPGAIVTSAGASDEVVWIVSVAHFFVVVNVAQMMERVR